MKKILVLGAGKSSSYLIRYLLDHSGFHKWQVTVADFSGELALEKTKNHPNSRAIAFNIKDKAARESEISAADIVISLLPPTLHILAAKDCVKFGKNMVTASYANEAIKALDRRARKAGIIILNECGLDPGIDHLSAMQLLNRIRWEGGKILSFKSYCGGLIAPEFDNNPWHYKFTWNPRNVVLAGQNTARYLEDGAYRFIPPSRIFSQTELLYAGKYGSFEAYANRDSLDYIVPYGLEHTPTILRGTLRSPGYCKAWDHLVKLGLTDDSFIIPHSEKLTYRQLVQSFLPSTEEDTGQALAAFLGTTTQLDDFKKIKWLGLLDETLHGLENATPAMILQKLLEEKWKLQKGELDMIIMHHEIKYELGGKEHRLLSSLKVTGEDETYTAMAKTVGLPMAIAAKLILAGKVAHKGVQLPIYSDLYDPMLDELKDLGIRFDEKEE
jgi:saccharopine dehydrogenase-like NADP-dependent oxidoreductase